MKQAVNAVPAWLHRHANQDNRRAALLRAAIRTGKTLRNGLSIAGLAGITAFGVLYFNPHLAEDLIALSPFTTEQAEGSDEVLTGGAITGAAVSAFAANATVEAAPQKPASAMKAVALVAKPAPAHSEQLRVSSWIAKRYRVATDAAGMLVGATYSTAREMHLDPLLILAVIAIESRFNPFAESPVGAKGLMQVMANIHRDKFQPLGGVQAALNPVANIKVGATILKEYVNRSGSLEGGLKMYVGAGNNETDSGYGSKVIAEYNRLKEVAHGGKPVRKTTEAVVKSRPAPVPLPGIGTQEARNEETPLSEPA
ncbi:MAG: transglycosylase SLT domain-containing protein [Lacisediminimonas sp.]|nr:transglycosylase SLT domain-containing protein [Lacisediminimonas sp.]